MPRTDRQPDFYGNIVKPTTGCCWILATSTQCMRPAHYIMRMGEDGTSYRDYAAFCPEHMVKAAAQQAAGNLA